MSGEQGPPRAEGKAMRAIANRLDRPTLAARTQSANKEAET